MRCNNKQHDCHGEPIRIWYDAMRTNTNLIGTDTNQRELMRSSRTGRDLINTAAFSRRFISVHLNFWPILTLSFAHQFLIYAIQSSSDQPLSDPMPPPLPSCLTSPMQHLSNSLDVGSMMLLDQHEPIHKGQLLWGHRSLQDSFFCQ